MIFDGILTANENTVLIIAFCVLAFGALAFMGLFVLYTQTTNDDVFGDDTIAFGYVKARFIAADPGNEAAYTNVTVSTPRPMNLSSAMDRLSATRCDRDADQRLFEALKDSGFIA
ncbi:hypothetical protein D9758_015390 [Tetrapyrgos nigripes]|uniref:Uncharacterized protein n=1 Tax=Tetrapyrgos nigripes TaxID=182062 RepID=A0A8H5FIY2_9AGAR|nr:hypothetical protein D9758_015390 [Tetrapyrgos nigripes]